MTSYRSNKARFGPDDAASNRGFTMTVPDDDARPADDFEDMVRLAARDARVSGARYSLQRARSGSYALLGAALLFAITALFSIFSFSFLAVEDWRLGAVVLYLSAAGAFLILFFAARRDPLLPSTIGLVIYGVLLLPSVVILANELWIVELIILIAMIDGVRAGFHHRRIIQRALLSHGSTEPLPTQKSPNPLMIRDNDVSS
jgi:hypothetical protein